MRFRRTLGATALAAATTMSFVLPASSPATAASPAGAVSPASAASPVAAVAPASAVSLGSAVSAAPVAAAVPLASAAGSCGHAVFSPDGGAMACFNPTGEHLFVCDTAADDHHPGAWYLLSGISWRNVQYDLSAGNCHDLNLDLPETGGIQYQACNYEGTRELSCSSYAYVSAKG